MTKTHWLIIASLLSAVVLVFACLAFLFVSMLPSPSPQAQEVPTVFVVVPTRQPTPVPIARPTSTPPSPTRTLSPTNAIATPTEQLQLIIRKTVEPQPTMTTTAKDSIPPRKTYRHSFPIQESYDRISGATIVTLLPPRDFSKWTNKPANLFVGYGYQGTIPSPPKAVSFNLTTLIWYNYACYDLALLLNGERRLRFSTTLTENKFPGQVGTTTVISMLLPLDDFLEVANANQIEGRVCNIDFVLSGEQMEALRDVASRMKP